MGSWDSPVSTWRASSAVSPSRDTLCAAPEAIISFCRLTSMSAIAETTSESAC